jgi:hypothetical protein
MTASRRPAAQRHTCRVKLWLYHGPGGWYFVTLPKRLAAKIKFAVERKNAWGSIRVKAQIGRTRWATSLFPDSKAGSYLLPVKADVRRKEKLAAGDTVALAFEIGA